MAVVSLSHVKKHYEGPLVLDDVTLDIRKGRKIGVIGQNGSGKTTLLRILAGEIEPSDGRVVVPRGLRIAYQAQELACDPKSTVLEEMDRVFAEERRRARRLRELEELLGGDGASGQEERWLAEYSRLQDEHDATGGYDVEQRIAAVLSGLGLPQRAWSQPIASFSGGERNIISLARVLLSSPDLILLDEPSNHLDMDGVEWFVRFVRNSPATIVMVSHDRHLLDQTVDEIWEVRRGKVVSWSGNYSAWKRQKAEALALQERRYKNQQRLIKRIEFQARRLRDMARAYDDPGQAKRAKAMLRRLERMETVERPDEGEARFHARLGGGERHGRIALHVKGFSFSYGDRSLFDGADLEIGFGERVCLVGPNGCGKSTLFKEILRRGAWDDPVLRLGKSVKVGEFHQFHEEALDLETSLHDWIMRATGLYAQPASELLHRFLFSRDDLERPIKTLSGGEKSRLQLARLVHAQVNFLMLDEPTNHLDLQACEQLEGMLQDFEGTLFIISHDRYFLEKLVDVVVEVRDRKLVRHPGSFREWWQERQAAVAASGGGTLHLRSRERAERETKAAGREEREARKEQRRRQRRLETRQRRIEEEIARLEARIEDLMKEMEEAWSTASGRADTSALERDLQESRERVAALYAEWEEVVEAAERERD